MPRVSIAVFLIVIGGCVHGQPAESPAPQQSFDCSARYPSHRESESFAGPDGYGEPHSRVIQATNALAAAEQLSRDAGKAWDASRGTLEGRFPGLHAVSCVARVGEN